MIPGEIFVADGELVLNEGRASIVLVVSNTGDRPIQVGSHYHFFETNQALVFDRTAARKRPLPSPAGVRSFPPPETVSLPMRLRRGLRLAGRGRP